MTTSSTGRAIAAAGLLATLAACNDATSPGSERFDSQRVQAGVAAVEKVAASTALASLQQVTRFGGGVGQYAARLDAPAWSTGLADAVGRVTRSATDAGSYLIPVMRPSVLGMVFTYDPAERSYVPSTRTGAPANGVRFILYAESGSGDPVVGQEIGYADLTDEQRNSATLAAVKLVVVTQGVIRLSYAFSLTPVPTSPSFTVQGYLVDGDDRLDFDIAASSALLGSGPATMQATLKAPRQGFEVRATLEGTPGDDDNGEMDLTITSGSDAIVVDAAVVNGQLEATFTVNGTLLAHATGRPSAPDIGGEGGRDLTEAEYRALARIVDMADAIFELVDDLVEPAGRLLLIALGIGG